MKTFFKLIVAVAALGFATANAQNTGNSGGGNSSQQTPGQAAAIKAVEDAMKTGDTSIVAEAMSQAVQAFPEMAGALVQAAIGASPNIALINTIAFAAGFAAPNSLSQITVAISSMKVTITSLAAQTVQVSGGDSGSTDAIADSVIQTAQSFAETGAAAGSAGGGGEDGGDDGSTTTPPPVVSAP
jgi:hypothetical protein